MTTYPVFTTGTINATDGNFTGTVDIDTELDVTGATITGLSHTSLDDIGTNTHPQIDTHIASTSNPHQVTLEQAAAQTGITGLTKGDLLVYGGSSAFIRLAVGTDLTMFLRDSGFRIDGLAPTRLTIPELRVYGSWALAE